MAETDVAEYKQDDFVVLPEDDLSHIIPTEANHERMSHFLFPSPSSPDLNKIRRYEDDKYKGALIEITPMLNGTCYTSKTYDVYLAIVDIWREKNFPDEVMKIKLSDILDRIGLTRGGKNYQWLQMELKRLHDVKVSWYRSFQGVTETIRTEHNLRILDTYNFMEKKHRTTSNSSKQVEIRLDERIRRNINGSIVIPVNFTARQGIKVDTAKVLYNRIDNVLAKKPIFSIKMSTVVEEQQLILKNKDYRYPSRRIKEAHKIQEALHGIECSDPTMIMQAVVKPVSDSTDNDVKIVVTRKPKNDKKTKKPSSVNPDLKMVCNDNDQLEYLVDMIADVVGEKKTNHGLYKTFARYYSEPMIFHSLGLFKETMELLGDDVKNPGGMFSNIMHKEAHKRGLEWIKPCGIGCKFRQQSLESF